MKPFGHYWETVHTKTGQVVNSGFVKGDLLTPGAHNSNVAGFHTRTIPLFLAGQETEDDISAAYRRGERNFVQGGRIANPYDKTTHPMSHKIWQTAVKECRKHGAA